MGANLRRSPSLDRERQTASPRPNEERHILLARNI